MLKSSGVDATSVNIKHDMFSQSISSARLRNIQQLTKSNTDVISVSKIVPDAILCIQGIDSQYNAGCQQLIDYLLFDFHELCRNSPIAREFTDEVLDDLIILVKKQNIHVCCNPKLYMHILPFISHWRNLSIHCLNSDEYEDGEAAEDFKIRSLLEMLNGVGVIGIPLFDGGSDKSEVVCLEKWPILQAVGLEEFGPDRDFTMNYMTIKGFKFSNSKMCHCKPMKIVDVSKELHNIYKQIDPVYIEIILKNDLSLFERHWASMVDQITTTDFENRNRLLKENVEEPLKTYFYHGLIGKSKNYRGLSPFLHFGKTSVMESLHSNSKAHYSVPLNLKSCGVGGNNAPFMVCQAVAPTSPISCARTYFFCPELTSAKINDLWITRAVYDQVVEGSLAAIESYVNTCDIDEARETALEYMSNLHENMPLLIRKHLMQKDAVKVTFEAFDRFGRIQSLIPGVRVPFMKTITFTIYDLPSIEFSGYILGSLIFSETFIESAIILHNHDRSAASIDSDYIIVTEQIPRIIHWNLEPTDPKNFPKDPPPLYKESVNLKVMDSTNSIALPGTLSIYDVFGIAVGWQSCGEILVSMKEIVSMQIYLGDTNEISMIIVNHNTKMFPLGLYDDGMPGQLIIFLQPKTKAYRTFYGLILPSWQSKLSNLIILPSLPDNLQKLFLEQTHLYKMKHEPLNGIKSRTEWPSILKSFMAHAEVAMCMGLEIEQNLFSIVMGEQKELDEEQSEKIPVTIISGIPGSFKDNLATAITKYTEENIRWIQYNQRLDSASEFVPSVIYDALSSAVSSALKKKSSARYSRILLLTPGFADIVQVVHAILNHPDLEIRSSVTIGSITCCIDPCNAFMSKSLLTFPTLLNQCLRGWVNNVVLSSNKEGLDYAYIRHLIRTCNPRIPLFVVNQGEVTRSTDLEVILSTNAFNQINMVRARYMSLPQWLVDDPEIILYPPMNEVILRFKPFLSKDLFLLELKELRNGTESNCLSGNIYHIRGRTTFEDTGEFVELQFTTKSNILTCIKIDPQVADKSEIVCFLIFTGCQLDEKKLKDWIRKCTLPKYIRRPHRSVESLTNEEIAAIQKENHLESLPEGWFYNGQNYVNLSGEKKDIHPDMPQFMENYVKKINMKIEQYNKDVDANNSNDIFYDIF